eukprot:930376-Amphidinium_carterae.1
MSRHFGGALRHAWVGPTRSPAFQQRTGLAHFDRTAWKAVSAMINMINKYAIKEIDDFRIALIRVTMIFIIARQYMKTLLRFISIFVEPTLGSVRWSCTEQYLKSKRNNSSMFLVDMAGFP